MIDNIFSIYHDPNLDKKIVPLSSVVVEVKKRNIALREENLLSLSYGKIIRKDINSDGGLLPASFDGYNIIESGDIVLRLTDLQNDKRSLRTGMALEKGIITSAYTTIRPKGVEARWLAYTLYAYDIQKIFYSLGSGLRQSMIYSDLKNLPIYLPPVEEQCKIADYLDKNVDTLNSVINAKSQVIKLLTDASHSEFTKFFGHPHFSAENEMPTRRLGPCLLANDGGVWGDDPSGSENSLVLRSTEISQRGYWRDLENAARRKLDKKDATFARLKVGDIVVTKASGSAEHIGKAAITTEEVADLNACFGNFMQRIRVDPDAYLPTYLYYFLKSWNARTQLNFLGTTSTGLMNVSAEVISNLRLPIVSIQDQKKVISILTEIEQEFSIKLRLLEHSIAKCSEFKSSLITASVTGSIDVFTGRDVH